MDRRQLAEFVRARREALQPEEVGLPRGSRRRAHGLRREEVAALSGMSADYYSRIEQLRGPMPSEQMLSALARALRLSPFERDHLFRLGGFAPPPREHDNGVSPTLQRVFERLYDVPALVMTNMGEVLVQNPQAKALIGDYTRFSGLSRFLVYRWFTDPSARDLFPPEDHTKRGRVFTADLRVEYAADPGGQAGEIVTALLAASPEFAEIWRLHEVDVTHYRELKRYRHPTLGELELYAHPLLDVDHAQYMLVYAAVPGSPSDDKLKLLVPPGHGHG
ncbi:helix-turn-helix transcriptional regulator [Actinoplanes sp. NPDC023714]|uniref:helix-turn-helix transcriptional regulator n=1 Tax=Actinoplanes sp. NPDC023714 TaxID=3154322 RepID=UPI0033D839D4